MKRRKRKWNDQDLISAVKESLSYAEVLRKLGLAAYGSNYAMIKKEIKRLQLDTSHMTGKVWNFGKRYRLINPPKPLSEILVENSDYTSISKLRYRLIKEGLKEAKCECCNQTEWLGQPIPLELHHINGVKDDLRIENLQILCPNCHAFTDNYRGKNQHQSAQKETSKVESPKFKEILPGSADDNLEPSSRNRKGAETRREKPKLPPRYCEYCGKELSTKQYRNKYCSQECAHGAISKRPGVIELLEAFKMYKSYVQVGKHFNVTDNAVRRWVDLYKIESMVKEQSSAQTE